MVWKLEKIQTDFGLLNCYCKVKHLKTSISWHYWKPFARIYNFIHFSNTGPCSLNEVFFPQSENSSFGIGSCYYINHNGKVRFHEANSVCLDSSSRGSLRSPFNKRDPDYDLVLGVLNFLYLTSSTTLRLGVIKFRSWKSAKIILLVNYCILNSAESLNRYKSR